jgi:hypothetical protein
MEEAELAFYNKYIIDHYISNIFGILRRKEI